MKMPYLLPLPFIQTSIIVYMNQQFYYHSWLFKQSAASLPERRGSYRQKLKMKPEVVVISHQILFPPHSFGASSHLDSLLTK